MCMEQYLMMDWRWRALGKRGLQPNSRVTGITVGTLYPDFPSTHSCQQHVLVSSSPKSVFSLMMFTLPASQNPLETAVTASFRSISSIKFLHSPLCLRQAVRSELCISQAPSLCLLLISFYFHSIFSTHQFVQHSFYFFKAKID